MNKWIIVSLWIMLSMSATNIAMAQKASSKKTITETIQVEGVCQQCKQRIEKAALIKGVRFAEWDATTQELKVAYRPHLVEQEDIEKAIAQQGHNTENVKADDSVYEQLPSCCAYKTVAPH